LRAAETALAEILGEVTTEEILNNIFSKILYWKVKVSREIIPELIWVNPTFGCLVSRESIYNI